VTQAFGAIGTWHPLLEKVESEGEHEGSRRTAKAKDGSRQVERLQELKPNERRYRYSIESTAMPIKNYVANCASMTPATA
jgi:mxaD protein